MRIFSKMLSVLLLVCILAVIFSACTEDPYKDYISSGLKAKDFPLNPENNFINSIQTNENAKIFEDYESFLAYDFPLDYSEEFFEKKNLLVFVTVADPADEMQFLDILTHDGKLYPCYSRIKLSPNDPLYEDLICYLPFCAELAKSDNYKLENVIFKYR